MKKIYGRMLAAAIALISVLTGCTSGSNNTNTENLVTAAENTDGMSAVNASAENANDTPAAKHEPIKAIYAEIKTEFNDSFDLSEAQAFCI